MDPQLLALTLGGLVIIGALGRRIVCNWSAARRKLARQRAQLAENTLTAGHAKKAEDIAQSALALFGARVPAFERALLLNWLSEAERALRKYDGALRHGKEALALLEQAGSPGQRAEVLNNLGVTHLEMGHNDDAVEALNAALVLAREGRDSAVERRTLLNLGGVYLYHDDDERAFGYLTAADSLPGDAGREKHQAAIDSNLAAYWMRRGKMGNARKCLMHAVEASQGLANRAIMLNNLAHLHRDLGQRELAVERFGEALSLARQARDRRLEGIILNGLATVALARQHWQEAHDLLEQSLVLRRETLDRAGEGATLDGIAGALEHMGREEEALPRYEQALQLRHDAGDRRGEATTLHNLGTLLSKSDRDVNRGRTLLKQALDLREQTGDRSGLAITLENLGMLEDSAGSPEVAIERLKQSIDVHEVLRVAAIADDLQQSLDRNAARVYRIAVGILLRLGRNTEAFELTERARARAFVERMRSVRPAPRAGVSAQLVEKETTVRAALAAVQRGLSREAELGSPRTTLEGLVSKLKRLRSQYEEIVLEIKLASPEYGSLVSWTPVPLAELQADLGSDTTLLSYFETLDHTFAFVVTAKTVHVLPLQLSVESLADTLASFRRFDRSHNAEEELGQLYRWLVEPVRGALSTPLVAIAATHLLHYVPFAALANGGRSFGEDHTLFHVPSATAFHFIKQKRPAGLGSVLAVACAAAKGMKALPHAGVEVQSVGSCYPVARIAIEPKDATERVVRSEAANVDVLHLAAHAGADPQQPLFSRIVLYSDDEDDGQLELHEIYDLRLDRSPLVVLSACDTQIGVHTGGDEIESLGRGFFFAGASTVVASLWEVDDEATAMLVTEFHRQITRGIPKAQALQYARAHVAAQEAHRHPYFWSAFVLSGDPGTHPAP